MRKENGAWVSKGLNLAATSEFGRMLVIWGPDASIITRETIEEEARTAARRYNDQTDYLVALGSPSLIAAFSWAIGVYGKELRVLEWDRSLQRYYPTLGETNRKGR